MSRNKRLNFFAGTCCGMGLLLCLTYFLPSPPPPAPPPPSPPPAPVVTYDAYGIPSDQYAVEEWTIERNQTFSDLLAPYGLPPSTINQLAEKARPTFNVRHIRSGKPFRVYRDESSTAQVAVYTPTPMEYVVFDLRDSLRVYRQERPVTVVEKTVQGVITSSPYETLVEQGANPALAAQLAEVFDWQIDFYRIQYGDRFSVVYEEKMIDGVSVGLGRILAATFEHAGETYNAYYFDHDQWKGYFDDEGKSLRLAFLKAPLKYTRISSRYTKRRFHPVQKRYKAHLGTDYAAPTGTPIRATSDGVILNAQYARYNGNYVKIKHNDTYTTGYLHMSRIADGIRPGVRVRQGDVIGYVGSTGLATGPHLCYRFWKNGVQVDPYQQDLPPAEPIDGSQRLAFESVKSRYEPMLKQPDPLLAQASLSLLPVLSSALPSSLLGQTQ